MYRRYLGLAFDNGSLQAVCLRRKRGRLQADWATAACVGLQPTADRPLLEEVAAFVDSADKLLQPLTGGEDRLGLSLPDGCGRTVIVHLQEQPAAAEEEKRMLQWKLRDLLPCPVDEMRIAYDRLSDGPDGSRRYAVQTLRETIFGQLSDALGLAGFQLDFVGFRSWNIWRMAAACGILPERHLFLAESDHCLSLLAARQGRLDACRTLWKGEDSSQFVETARTLTDWARQKLIEAEQSFLVFSGDPQTTERANQLGKYLGRPLTMLTIHEQLDWDNGRVASRPQRQILTAAAAAARLLAGA